jgi:hypothetical protein
VITVRDGVSWAGIFSGPLAWLISTQANYALAAWPCAHRSGAIPSIALALTFVALAGAALSWRALSRTANSPVSAPRKPRSEVLVAIIGIALASLFALVIAMHGLAGIVFSGCEQ